MWTVVYIAESKPAAERIVATLKDEGILATMKHAVPSNEDGCFEILVAECEAEEAHEIIRIGEICREERQG